MLKLAPELLIRLLLRQIRMDERRPRWMRRRDEAPVGRALADDLECLLHGRQHVLAEERLVEAVHHVRRGQATHRDARAILLGVLEHTLAKPLGNEVERLRVGVLDAHALHVRIEVRDVDELGAALVGRLGGRTRLLLEADLGRDQHDLAFLHVRPVDRELGEAGNHVACLLGAHAALSRSRLGLRRRRRRRLGDRSRWRSARGRYPRLRKPAPLRG